jgi:lipid-A-disaccharide synthase
MPPKLGILAGGGPLPELLVRTCQDSGRDFLVIGFQGHAEKQSFADVPHAWVRLGAAGQSIKHLRDAGCKELVMAGTIKRPSLASLRPDAWALRFFAKSGAQSLGDDGLLKALVKTLEETEGFRVIGADDLLSDLLATKGAYGQVEPDWQAEEDIKYGIRAALDIGRRDIGQGAVVQMGQVLCVEDAKGTDALLKQAQKVRLSGPGGVLVKVKKPGQEHRADLPTIGVTTVEGVSAAGLRGIAIETGGALVVDRDAVIKAADAAGIFVFGIDLQDHPEARTESDDGGMVTADPSNPLVFLIAGEPSGDFLGAQLMQALKKKTDGRISFAGVGGARMEEQGIKSLFPMAELSVMGIAEILPRLPGLLRRISETVDAVKRLSPSCLVTIDSPDFNFRVAKRLKGKGIPLIHYVAPSVWAWRPGRANKIAGFLDHLLTLLPFEPPFFEAVGLPATFVGHPVLDGDAGLGDGPGFRDRHAISATDRLITVLPGSRMSEITRLHGIFGETLFMLKKKFPHLRVVVPTLNTVAGPVRRLTAEWPVPVLVVEGDQEKFDAFAASEAALAASGTVALELAVARTPAVIAYKTNILTALIARWLVKARFAHLVNLILEREAIPEFLQGACRSEFLAAAMEDLLADTERRDKQISAYDEALKELKPKGDSPAALAAGVVINAITEKGTPE